MSLELTRHHPRDSDQEPGPLAAVSPRVSQLLAGQGTHAVFSDDGSHFVGIREHWVAGTVSEQDRGDLEHQRVLLDQQLCPVDRGILLARIMTLLAHYRQDAMPPEVERALAADWVDDLGEFPRWAVDQACRAWRRDPKRYRFRPLPGDLRQLCLGAVADAQEWRRRVLVLLASLDGSASGRLPAASTAAASHQVQAIALHQRIAALAAAKRPH